MNYLVGQMAKYIISESYVDIIGGIWLPYGATCAMRKKLTFYDIQNIRSYDDGVITREGLENWLGGNSGDFSRVDDFRASIEDGDQTIDIDWAKGNDSEFTYCDCMYPAEEFETAKWEGETAQCLAPTQL